MFTEKVSYNINLGIIYLNFNNFVNEKQDFLSIEDYLSTF